MSNDLNENDRRQNRVSKHAKQCQRRPDISMPPRRIPPIVRFDDHDFKSPKRRRRQEESHDRQARRRPPTQTIQRFLDQFRARDHLAGELVLAASSFCQRSSCRFSTFLISRFKSNKALVFAVTNATIIARINRTMIAAKARFGLDFEMRI